MKKKSNTPYYIVALVLFLGGVGYLAFTGLAENSVYFLNVHEALAAPAEKVKSARLFGTVAEQKIERPDSGLGVKFILEDKDDPSRTLLVDYQGVVPDTFQTGAEVIVEGGLTENKMFKATSLMTKCPSKYEKENRG